MFPDDQTSGLGGGQEVAGGGSPSLDHAVSGGGFERCGGGCCLGHQFPSELCGIVLCCEPVPIALVCVGGGCVYAAFIEFIDSLPN